MNKIQLFKKIGFYSLLTVGTLLSFLVMANQLDGAESVSVGWMFKSVLVINFTQGLILCIRSLSFLLWIPTSIVVGWLGLLFGYICFYILLFSYIPAGFGFCIGGMLLGLVQAWVLQYPSGTTSRHFSKPLIMVFAMGMAYWFTWSIFVIMLIQNGYFGSTQNVLNTAELNQVVMQRGFLYGLFQGLGIFFVLDTTRLSE